MTFHGPVAVALGSEGHGLPHELEQAGRPLTIPMAAGVESLNVASAAAIILYEIARQRASGPESLTKQGKARRV
jgi:TrmH family RNA methyltransferase